MSPLERLFQNGVSFPMEAEQEEAFAASAEEARQAEEKLREAVTAEVLSAYLEASGQFHDRERRLAFENGFLLAFAICMEVRDRHRRAKL